MKDIKFIRRAVFDQIKDIFDWQMPGNPVYQGNISPHKWFLAYIVIFFFLGELKVFLIYFSIVSMVFFESFG